MSMNGNPANGHSNGHANGTGSEQLTLEFYQSKSQWEAEAAQAKSTPWKHTTLSGNEIDLMNTPDDLKGWSYSEKLGFPGQYPYTRGIHPNMYHGKVWTMRQFAGFGTPEDTNG